MKPFERSDEATRTAAESERLSAFTKALWDALVPRVGECVSVQGELIRTRVRLESELFGNGLSNYYWQRVPGGTVAENHYGEMLLFMLGTLVENRNNALEADDVHYFEDIGRLVGPDWIQQARARELTAKAEESETEGTPDLSEAERAELEALESAEGPPWELVFSRAGRCIANWCLANPEMVDRQGKPTSDGGVRDVRHVFSPPPRPPSCPMCKGKGWLPPLSVHQFPEVCVCKRGPAP